MDEGTPISYQALAKGTPMLTASAQQFGRVELVSQVPEEDLFEGIIVATAHGQRFVSRDQVDRITALAVTCSLTEEQAANLPEPSGSPVYHADSSPGPLSRIRNTGLTRRLFSRTRWVQDKD